MTDGPVRPTADPAAPDAAATSDDRTARFVRLLTRHERTVYAYILSMVPHAADADEIHQETNVRLWEQFDRFESADAGGDFGAWACTVAHYQVLTHRKRRERERLRFSDTFVELVAEQMRTTAGEAEPRHRALLACVEQMAEPSRDLLRRVYGRGQSIRDAAAALGRGAQATYKALQRIRRTLYDCICARLDAERDA